MLGRSVADPAPSSSWDVPGAEVSDAEISDPEQPATSKAAEHARITRSILPARDSPPPLVGVAPTLPESLFNAMFCTPPGYSSRFGNHDQHHRYPLQGSPFPGRTVSVRDATRNIGK